MGLCDVDAVEALVTEGPAAVWDLIALGADFDRGDTGGLSLTREGGHHRDRILHAGGDATGARSAAPSSRRSTACATTRASRSSSTPSSSTC